MEFRIIARWAELIDMPPRYSTVWPILFALALCVIGIILIVLPEAATEGRLVDQKSVYQTIGGVFVGSAVTLFMSIFSTVGLANRVSLILRQGTNDVSNKESKYIENHHRKYYYYYRTSIGKQVFWRCLLLDFTHGYGAVRLIQRVALKNQDGQFEYYKVEALTRFGRLLLMFYPEERTVEPSMVSVFNVNDKTPYAGVKHLMTWDRTNLIAPCLVSTLPVAGWSKKQDAAPPNVSAELTATWRKEIKADLDSALFEPIAASINR